MAWVSQARDSLAPASQPLPIALPLMIDSLPLRGSPGREDMPRRVPARCRWRRSPHDPPVPCRLVSTLETAPEQRRPIV